MSELNRRAFVKNTAGTAAGITAFGALAAAQADAKRVGPEPIVAWIGDPRKGEIVFMSSGREITVHDRKLVARIAAAAR